MGFRYICVVQQARNRPAWVVHLTIGWARNCLVLEVCGRRRGSQRAYVAVSVTQPELPAQLVFLVWGSADTAK
jgi:hypothetical protein